MRNSLFQVLVTRRLGRVSSRLLAAAFVLVCFTTRCHAQPQDVFANFDEYANAALTDWNTPGMAIVVVKNGEILFAHGYGNRRVGENSPVDTSTIFPIASITKSFNATGLAVLVDEGLLKWNDPVTKHLPEFQLHDPSLTREITLADLLSHRTGLEDPELVAASGSIDRREMIRRAKYLRPVAPFRTGWNYNNLMISISGEILERVSGQSWADFIRRRVFEPLEMNSTVADVLKLEHAANVATTYVSVDGALKADRSWNLPLSDGWQRYREAIRPAGSICSSADDMAKFLALHLSGGQFRGRRLLKGATILEMQAVHSALAFSNSANSILPSPKFLSGWGFGWEVRDYRGRKLVMHRGSTGTVLAMMPEEKIGLVVLTNLGCGIQYMVMHDVFDRLLSYPRPWTNRDWTTEVIDKYRQEFAAVNTRLLASRNKGLATRFHLDEYAGAYESDLYGQIVIKHSNDRLSLHLGKNCNAELVHWEGEQFRATLIIRFPEDWFITFGVKEGKIMYLELRDVQSGKPISTFTRVGVGVRSNDD